MKGNYLNCAFQNLGDNNNIAIIGSSHASHLFYGLKEYYKGSSNSFSLFPVSSQSPFENLKITSSDTHWLIQKAYDYILSSKNIKTVILADYAANNVDYVDLNNPELTDSKEIYKKAVERTFEKLKKFKVLVLLDTPLLPFDPSLCNNRPYSFKKSKCSFVYKNETCIMHKNVISKVAKKYSNVKVFDLSTLFCKDSKCKIKIKNKVMFMDNNHLNINGSLYVAPFVAEQIKKLQNH